MKALGFEVSAGELLLVAVVVVGGSIYLKKKLVEDVGLFSSDPENRWNKGAEAIYSGITGSKNSPGVDLYEAGHDEAETPWWADIIDRISGVDKIEEQREKQELRIETLYGKNPGGGYAVNGGW